MQSPGISDIALFIPRKRIELSTIVEQRGLESPRLERKLRRALETTGQRAIRFPREWEDSATLAAEAAGILCSREGSFDPSRVRFLVAGTETTLDFSKPLASYVQGMLQNHGIGIPENLSTFQLQHACAGGTLALVSVASLLQTSGRPGETGIILSSDIARYKTSTTAEITQGAGAAAVLTEADPKLVELSLAGMGFASFDVDDFFRPLGQETAEVKGSYSVQCYLRALQSAFEDHCRRSGKEPAAVLRESDYFVLHTPFRNMPETGMVMLYSKYAGIDADGTREILSDKGFYDGIDPVAEIGNIYTGSVFLTLAFLLKAQYEKLGDAIVGRKILLGSYGSGNTMTIISGTVASAAPGVLRSWNLDSVLNDTAAADQAEYEAWIERSKNGTGPLSIDSSLVPAGGYYLKGIREDGYREYGFSGAE